MTTDLEDAIVETMRPRGDGPIDVTALRRAAVQQAGSIRRRRIALGSAGLAVVAVLAVVPFIRVTGIGPDQRVGGPGAEEASFRITPPAADAPGAKLRPDLVGTDTSVLHFDVDLTGMLATGANWTVADGVESVRLWTSDFDHYNHTYVLTNDAAKLGVGGLGGDVPAETRQVAVHGQPATATFWPTEVSSNKKPDVPTWMVRWRPAAGLWAVASLFTTDPADAVRAAEAMRLNGSHRCVAPLRLDPAPAGYRVVHCSLSFGHLLPWSGSFLEIEGTGGVRYEVSIGPGGLDADHPFQPNQVLRGRPAMLEADVSGTKTVYVPISGGITLQVRGPYKVALLDGTMGQQYVPAIDAELLGVAERVVVSPNLADPETWPARTLG